MDGHCQKPESRAIRQDTPGTAAFDYERSLARLGGDPCLFNEIVVLFLEDSPELLERGRQALARRNLAELERAAHSLKGLSVNFDALQLAASAASVEQHARDHDLEGAAAYFSDLEVNLLRLRDELKAFRDGATGQA